jgi:hypothetical protein
MSNLNKSNILTTIEPVNRILKKKVEKIIFKILVQNVPSSVRVGSFPLRNQSVETVRPTQTTMSTENSSYRQKFNFTSNT